MKVHTKLRLLPLVGLFAACNGGTVDDTSSDVPEPTPYIVEDDGNGEIDVDLAAVEEDLQAVLDTIWTLNAEPVLDAYASVESEQTEICPRTYVNQGNVYWFDQCTTEGGTQFSGYGFYYDYVDYPIGEQFVGRLTLLQGAARVDTAGGNALDVAGAAQVIDADHIAQPARFWQSTLRGTFSWDGPEAQDTWLSTELAPDFTMQAFYRTDLQGAMVSIDGGLSGMDGVSAVVFDGVAVIDRSLGGMCPEEGSGAISVRLDDGTWIDVLFDGPDPQTFEGDPAQCDGKGRAYYRGELLGEVELDFTTLFFEGAPW